MHIRCGRRRTVRERSGRGSAYYSGYCAVLCRERERQGVPQLQGLLEGRRAEAVSDECKKCRFLEECEGYGYELDQKDQMDCPYYEIYMEIIEEHALEGY